MSVEAAPALLAGLNLDNLTAGVFGLVGVVVGGVIQMTAGEITWRRQRRLQEQTEARDRQLAALTLAEHLESYVSDCKNVVETFSDIEWPEPYSWTSRATDGPVYGKPMAWPDHVEWKALKVETVLQVSNLRRRSEVAHEGLRSAVNVYDGSDYHTEEADEAARIGLEAWRLAVSVRRSYGLSAFDVGDDMDFSHSLTSHIARREEIEREKSERLANMAANLGPF